MCVRKRANEKYIYICLKKTGTKNCSMRRRVKERKKERAREREIMDTFYRRYFIYSEKA